MKRILSIASMLLIAAPLSLFAAGGGRARGGGPNGIHTPGTGQTSGAPQGTPGGQRLRDGSGAGQQKKQGQKQGQRQGKGQGQNQGQCPNGQN